MDLVKFLSSDPTLNDHISVTANKDFAFIHACETGNMQLLKYITTSPELTEHANFHSQRDTAFKNSVIYEQKEVLEYLIFEMEIEKTSIIRTFLDETKHHDRTQVAIKMFDSRESKQRLDNGLDKNNKVQSKLKM